MGKNEPIKDLKLEELIEINAGGFWKDLGYVVMKGILDVGDQDRLNGTWPNVPKY